MMYASLLYVSCRAARLTGHPGMWKANAYTLRYKRKERVDQTPVLVASSMVHNIVNTLTGY